MINHTPDTALLAVGDVERSVGTLRHTVRPEDSGVRFHQRRFSGKAIGENLEIAGRLAVCKRLECDVVTILRHGRPIPGSMESDEGSVAIVGGKLVSRVEHEIDRSPMRWKSRGRKCKS